MNDPHQTPVVLWWSHGDRDYSRDRVLRTAFRSHGWEITDFSPTFSRFGDLEASLRRVAVPDLVWVPCFRQRDVAAAKRWASRHQVPLIFDPLISAYDKQVFERNKFRPDTASAQRLLDWECGRFRGCSLVIADTHCHADFFAQTLKVSQDRLHVIPVGAEDEMFSHQPLRSPLEMPIDVLFYGTFISLQGADIIARAALQLDSVRWTFLGEGPRLQECREILKGIRHVRFLPFVPYQKLPEHIAAAHILLGVFGSGEKASRVIPNKVYQSLAVGRPVVTQRSYAYPAPLREMDPSLSGMTFIDAGSPDQLARAIRELSACPAGLPAQAVRARATYETFFHADAVRHSLADALASVFRDRHSRPVIGRADEPVGRDNNDEAPSHLVADGESRRTPALS